MNANLDKSRVVSAAALAAVSNVINLTNDRVEALAAGHGMVNVAVFSIANVVTEELLRGADISMRFANVRHQPLEDIMKKALAAAKASGADGANAALLTAATMYLAGTASQVGIPAGNRKLGATARMLAGVDRCGVAAIPTAKMNNKISGFPAVQAIYQAMIDGKLSSIDGRKVPMNVGGGPIYGHSSLGEDLVWPEMAENGARIGTQAMLDAMAGAAMIPHPFTAAILGSAAILEIIHSDAEVAEEYGTYGKTNSTYLVGCTAAKTAGLPEKLHLKVTGEEFETGKLIGDVGLILKDIGGPSVIGMMALDEIFAVFQEGISGFSGGPVNPPLGHMAAYAIIAMRLLLENGGNQAEAAEKICAERAASSFDPETALMSINLVTRKGMELQNGPVSETLILATEPARATAISRRAAFTFDCIQNGKTLEDVVRQLDEERQRTVETCASALLTGMVGQAVEIKVLRLESGARRTSKLAKKYFSFDPLVDIQVKVGENTAVLEGFIHDIVPAVTKGGREDVAWAVPLAAAVMDELLLTGCNIVNVVVPAATAAAMGANTPEEAAKIAEQSAFITVGIPGAKAAALRVASLAKSIVERGN